MGWVRLGIYSIACEVEGIPWKIKAEITKSKSRIKNPPKFNFGIYLECTSDNQLALVSF